MFCGTWLATMGVLTKQTQKEPVLSSTHGWKHSFTVYQHYRTLLLVTFVCLSVCVVLFETGSPSIALAFLKLTM